MQCRLGESGGVGKHGAVSEDKSPVKQAADLVVFAPIGFALEIRKMLPTLAERGRQQVQMAKMIGQFAVKQGQTEAEKRLVTVAAQADAVLSEFGLRPDERAADGLHPVGEADQPDPAPVRQAQSGPAGAALAIADYDSLAASQVIPRLAGLEPEELAAVGRYETAHRHRKTILGKIAQIQGA